MTYQKKVEIGDATLILGECLEVMSGMTANSVDAIITDPPYFKVKGDAWDNQWDNPAKFLEWVGLLCAQFERILKPNGSLYFFASPQMAARVEVEIGKRFNVLNSITWRKGAPLFSSVGWAQKTEKEALRTWLPETERIVFAEHYGADSIAKGEAGYEAKRDELRGFVFEPLRLYLDSEWRLAGLSAKDANEATETQMASHWFSRVQWVLPTKENYKKLQSKANQSGNEYLRKEYEELSKEYEELRKEYEELRRPFSVTAKHQWSDVWDFDPVQAYAGKHPCEKPQSLLCHILSASTKPDAVVFDPFSGSGSLAIACKTLGRKFLGVELSPEYFYSACERIELAYAQGQLFEPAPIKQEQGKLEC